MGESYYSSKENRVKIFKGMLKALMTDPGVSDTVWMPNNSNSTVAEELQGLLMHEGLTLEDIEKFIEAVAEGKE